LSGHDFELNADIDDRRFKVALDLQTDGAQSYGRLSW